MSLWTRNRPCFHKQCAFLNRFKYRQNAPFTVLVFIISPQFQIVSNTARMHHLPSLFSLFLCNSKSFQIPSECTIYRPCFHYFSAVPNCFKYRQNAPFIVLVFIFFLCSSKSFQIPSECTIYRPCFHFFSLQFQIVSNTVRIFDSMKVYM